MHKNILRSAKVFVIIFSFTPLIAMDQKQPTLTRNNSFYEEMMCVDKYYKVMQSSQISIEKSDAGYFLINNYPLIYGPITSAEQKIKFIKDFEGDSITLERLKESTIVKITADEKKSYFVKIPDSTDGEESKKSLIQALIVYDNEKDALEKSCLVYTSQTN